MTLEGTNTYLVGAPAAGEVVIVDPGPDLIAHRRAVDAAVAARSATVAAVVVTHHHPDHAGAAAWASGWGVSVFAFTPALMPAGQAAPLRDGDVLRRAGVTIETVHTPGHSSDHVCLRVTETGVVLTGDHILGRGSTVIAHPDGDMTEYLASLRRLRALEGTALYPGHGPVLTDPAGAVDSYLAHRLEREREILGALTAGERTPAGLVARVYAGVDPALHPVAERTVRAHLAKLVADGRATTADGEVYGV